VISDQPKNEEETRRGAYNRAKNALKSTEADYGVGLEGGIMETEVGMFSSAWCAIVSRSGVVSYGGGMHFHLPENVAQRIRNGDELGPIIDSITGESDFKKKGGAIEIFTNGLLSRTKDIRRLVELATTKFLTPNFYKKHT
jgi:inosine/xanthosine triphosphatase